MFCIFSLYFLQHQEQFMKSWIIQLIILFVGLFCIALAIYRRQLLNKAIFVKTINHAALKSIGDIEVNQDFLRAKFYWTVKNFSFKQITQIKAYTQTDWGINESEQIDILFDTGDKISFSGSLAAHREMVQVIVSKVDIQDKDWAWGFLPFFGDITGKDIVYEKVPKAKQVVKKCCCIFK